MEGRSRYGCSLLTVSVKVRFLSLASRLALVRAGKRGGLLGGRAGFADVGIFQDR